MCVVKANVIMSVEVCVMRGVGEFCVLRSTAEEVIVIKGAEMSHQGCKEHQFAGTSSQKVRMTSQCFFTSVSVCGAWDGTTKSAGWWGQVSEVRGVLRMWMFVCTIMLSKPGGFQIKGVSRIQRRSLDLPQGHCDQHQLPLPPCHLE